MDEYVDEYDELPDAIVTPTGETFPQPEQVLVAREDGSNEHLITAKLWRAEYMREGGWQLVAGEGNAGLARTRPTRPVGGAVPARTRAPRTRAPRTRAAKPAATVPATTTTPAAPAPAAAAPAVVTT